MKNSKSLINITLAIIFLFTISCQNSGNNQSVSTSQDSTNKKELRVANNQQMNADSNKILTFAEFLDLFPEIKLPAKIAWDSVKGQRLSNQTSKRFLDDHVSIAPEDKDCNNIFYSAIGKYLIIKDKYYGFLVKADICPIGSSYEEVVLFILDTEGKPIGNFNISYMRGINCDVSDYRKAQITSGTEITVDDEHKKEECGDDMKVEVKKYRDKYSFENQKFIKKSSIKVE